MATQPVNTQTAEIENPIPTIGNLSEIKTNGFYQLGNDIVKADCIGLPEFKTCVMPPITINKPNGNAVQIFIDPFGKTWCRARFNNCYQNWIDLDEVNERLNQIKTG